MSDVIGGLHRVQAMREELRAAVGQEILAPSHVPDDVVDMSQVQQILTCAGLECGRTTIVYGPTQKLELTDGLPEGYVNVLQSGLPAIAVKMCGLHRPVLKERPAVAPLRLLSPIGKPNMVGASYTVLT